mmetsp:Transcript_50971/g.110767  ORF Transcript_50971/g.110767 Transcript_50971/m.110767 type:complete len:554 (+) Transcript_50971:527-2188(+)
MEYIRRPESTPKSHTPKSQSATRQKPPFHAASVHTLASLVEHGDELLDGPDLELATRLYQQVSDSLLGEFNRFAPPSLSRVKVYRDGQMQRVKMAEEQVGDIEAQEEVETDPIQRGRLQLILGNWFASGTRGVQRNQTKACDFYEKASVTNPDNDGAIFMLAQCFHFGTGRMENATEAVRLYHVAAEKGNNGAWVALGQIYLRGKGGIATNITKAAELFEEAAGRHDAHAEHNLGLMWFAGWLGNNSDRNYTNAARHFSHAADRGHTVASHFAGSLHHQMQGRQETGTKVAVNHTRAVRYLKQMTRAGAHTDTRKAYDAFQNGRLSEALLRYELVALMGCPHAMVNAAYLIAKHTPPPVSLRHLTDQTTRGTGGFLPHLDGATQSAAARWLLWQRRAAVEGEADGITRLGHLAATGSIGEGWKAIVAPDDNHALDLYHEVTKRGGKWEGAGEAWLGTAAVHAKKVGGGDGVDSEHLEKAKMALQGAAAASDAAPAAWASMALKESLELVETLGLTWTVPHVVSGWESAAAKIASVASLWRKDDTGLHHDPSET